MNNRLNKMTHFPAVSCLIILSCIYSISTKDCQVIPAPNRFNCYPERNITREACEARGCCWINSTNVANTNQSIEITAPSCYYPPDFSSYEVVSNDETDFGKRIHLKLSASINTNGAVPNLIADIYYETTQRLRIKIYDADNKRYEAPLDVPTITQGVDVRDYQVSVTQKPFSLRVTRNFPSTLL